MEAEWVIVGEETEQQIRRELWIIMSGDEDTLQSDTNCFKQH